MENPWIEIADRLGEGKKDCFFLENDEYVFEADKARIEDFNNELIEHNKYISDKIILNTPPEPWRGNPLEANLIILSLNPGYDPNINKSIAKLIETNEIIRKKLAEFRKNTMLLKEHSFMPEESNNGNEGISCKEAEDMLSGWYWTKKFKTLREDFCRESGLDESEFYRRVAVIEFFGYSSTTCEKGFPLCGKKSGKLKSQEYTEQLIQDIVNRRKNRKDDIRFLILRAKDRWIPFLKCIGIYDEKLFLLKGNKGRCQSLSRENLSEDVYEEILKAIKKELAYPKTS